MKKRIILKLNRLVCKKESDGIGGSEPYIWPFMLTYDGNNLTPFPQPITNARIIIRDGIRAGDTPQIPLSVGEFIFDVPDISKLESIILVITLMEEDQTGGAAIKKGFEAYEQKMAEQLNLSTLFTIKLLKAAENQEQLDKLMNSLSDIVKDAVKAAIKATDSVFNFIDPDDSIDTAFISFSSNKVGNVVTPIQPQDFTLSFTDTVKVPTNQPFGPQTIDKIMDNYFIEGSLRVIDVANAQPCQAQIINASNAKAIVDSLNFQIGNLQNQLRMAFPTQKPAIIKQITVIEAKIPAAESNLVKANRALDVCRINDSGSLGSLGLITN